MVEHSLFNRYSWPPDVLNLPYCCGCGSISCIVKLFAYHMTINGTAMHAFYYDLELADIFHMTAGEKNYLISTFFYAFLPESTYSYSSTRPQPRLKIVNRSVWETNQR